MSCESVRELLPDYTLGTLTEEENAGVRGHLRGCAACRTEAGALDQGVALFASAAHAAEPPADLEDRVMTILAEEWADSTRPARRPPRWLAVAAVAAAVAGALAWGTVATVRGSHAMSEARRYRAFLQALGGRDVRVATLHSAPSSSMEGAAVLYDSEHGQSWVLVLMRSPGTAGTVNVTLTGGGRSIRLHPAELGEDGDGSTWLVTSADISRIRDVRVTNDTGRLLASGTTRAAVSE